MLSIIYDTSFIDVINLVFHHSGILAKYRPFKVTRKRSSANTVCILDRTFTFHTDRRGGGGGQTPERHFLLGGGGTFLTKNSFYRGLTNTLAITGLKPVMFFEKNMF